MPARPCAPSMEYLVTALNSVYVLREWSNDMIRLLRSMKVSSLADVLDYLYILPKWPNIFGKVLMLRCLRVLPQMSSEVRYFRLQSPLPNHMEYILGPQEGYLSLHSLRAILYWSDVSSRSHVTRPSTAAVFQSNHKSPGAPLIVMDPSLVLNCHIWHFCEWLHRCLPSVTHHWALCCPAAMDQRCHTPDPPLLMLMCIIPVCVWVLQPLQTFEQLPANFDCHQLHLRCSPASIPLFSTSLTHLRVIVNQDRVILDPVEP